MRRSSALRAVALLTLLAFTTSCLTTQLPPISSSGSGFQPLRDEQALWEKARDEEKKLLDNVKIYEDPLLVDYLEKVVGRLNPPGTSTHPAAEPEGEDQQAEGNTEEFERRMRPVIRDDARLNLENGRLKLAESQLRRALDRMPEDPESHFLLGRLRLAQADKEKDSAAQSQLQQEAEEAFREAIDLDPDRPAPHRELGLLLYRAQDFHRACAELRRYTRLAPDASDAERIRDYVLEMEQDGSCR